MVLPDRPIYPMHSVTSLMQYLSMWVSALRALKSCTSQIPPFFLATAKIGLLYLLGAGSITPSLSHLMTCFSTSSMCASGILNCLTKIGLSVFKVISCRSVLHRPRSNRSSLIASWNFSNTCMYHCLCSAGISLQNFSSINLRLALVNSCFVLVSSCFCYKLLM